MKKVGLTEEQLDLLTTEVRHLIYTYEDSDEPDNQRYVDTLEDILQALRAAIES